MILIIDTKTLLYKYSVSTFSQVSVTLEVEREASLLVVRILVPMLFLLAMSWATFVINAHQLVPRFAAGFIGFLSIVSVKTAAIADAPVIAAAAEISWFDVFFLYTTVVIGCAVLNVILGDAILQKYGHMLVFFLSNRIHCIPNVIVP